MPWFQFTMRRMMVYVAIIAMFLWGCMGVAQKLPHHHFAIFFAIAAAIADLGFSITYERQPPEAKPRADDPEDSNRARDRVA